MFRWTNPTTAELQSISRNQARHTSLIYRAESDLADSAESVMVKGNLEYADVPPVPENTWTIFYPPALEDDGCLALKYDVRSGTPLRRDEAIRIFCEVKDLAVRLDRWYRDVVVSDREIISNLLGNIGMFDSWLHPRGAGEKLWTKEVAVVIEKWSKVQEREAELQGWLDESAVLNNMVQKVIEGEDIAIPDRGVSRFDRGSRRMGYRGPMVQCTEGGWSSGTWYGTMVRE